ncbi:methionyl-tRNA formyltransferase [uncultured Bifidobacterium sp.]|uniref:methionyl-tRNA formyltransferase n=1 Tax=uncultured Bifidobacterium sp. TaxID=165187 RepID=UPI00260177DE|nr:methionyl-tRNA formyltransferase [uncultured Bifidobacterium sp.]
MLKLLFAGTPDVAVPALRVLAQDTENFDVVAVLTRPDAPSGRGRRLTPSPVKVASQELGIPVLECDPTEPAFLSELAATGAQAAAVVAYGRILRSDVLEALPQGWYNLHFSLLPQWRGAAPVQRAIWSGDTVTGATVFRITPGLDSGPILSQSTVSIGAHETAGDLLDRLSQDGASLLHATLRAMDEHGITAVDQPAGSYDRAEKIRTEDARIRFDVPVFAVDRQIRACTPEPGAWCVLHATHDGEDRSQKLHVTKAVPAPSENPDVPDSLAPGRVMIGRRSVWIGTLTRPIEILMVKPEGRREMPAADWARGARLDPDPRCN